MHQSSKWRIGLIALLMLCPMAGLRGAEDQTKLPVAQPFEWQAARSADTLDLSGHVPSAKAHDAIRAKAGTLFPKLKIVDTTGPAPGAPSGDFVSMAGHVLDALSELDGGGATVQDDQVTVSGTAHNGGDVPKIEKELRATLPKPFHLILLRIQPPVPR